MTYTTYLQQKIPLRDDLLLSERFCADSEMYVLFFSEACIFSVSTVPEAGQSPEVERVLECIERGIDSMDECIAIPDLTVNCH